MTNLKALLWAVLVFFCLCSPSRADLPSDFLDGTETEHNISDDGAASVPLEFGFPFYGTTYYYSWMHSNGVISLVGVNQNPPSSFCCSGVDLENGTTTITNFIAPLWTDLIQIDDDGGFYTLAVDNDGDGEPDSMRYLWDRIEEYYNQNENTFGVELFESGKIDMHHETINITGHNVSIGIKGNNNDQQIGIDYGQGSMSLNNYTNTYSGTPTYDITAQCAANPLYSPQCTGYAEAYAAWLYQQSCLADPLYDSGCPGYATAYYNQQCTLDPLYDTGCSGYEEAYFNQQCTLDPLYDTGCSGYEEAYFNQQCEINPLYDSGCSGYEQAFYNQQCELNPLYDTGCTGYEEAYYNQQCSINPLYDTGCTGYETAYYDYQCSLDPLYDSGCNGYADAYFNQQCSLDSLYDTQCPGYATAYYNQQCSLDALYDSGCEGYEEAYYETYIKPELDKQVAEASGTSDDATTTTPTIQSGEVQVTATGVRDPVESATNVSTTGDATIDEILRNNNDTTDTVVVEVTPVETPRVETTETTTQTETREEREEPEQELTVASLEREVEDERETESSSDVDEQVDSSGNDESSDGEQEGGGETETSSEGGDKPSESSRDSDNKRENTKEKIKKLVAEKAKNLANDMSEAASFEEQQKIQAQVLALIGFNPDFGTYAQNIIPQTAFYQDTQVPDTDIPKNSRGLRNGLAQQLLHEKMVDMQYNR